MFCGTDNILQSIPYIQHEWWNICKIPLVLQNIVIVC